MHGLPTGVKKWQGTPGTRPGAQDDPRSDSDSFKFNSERYLVFLISVRLTAAGGGPSPVTDLVRRYELD